MTGSDITWLHPLSCHIRITMSLDYNVTYTATLIDDSTPHYCMCTLHRKYTLRESEKVVPITTIGPQNGTETPSPQVTTVPTPEPTVRFTCLITETILGVK